ncbi:MAG: hypothetical protein AAGF56_08925, partial [Pseudomonadota bacterium]
DCRVFDLEALRQTGSLAFTLTPAGDLSIVTAHSIAGERLWNTHQGAPLPAIVMRRSEPTSAQASADQIGQ